MKKMNKISYLLFPGLLFLGACNSNTGQKVENSFDTMSQKVENAIDTVKSDYRENKDENFVKDVIKANTSELHLIALAKEKGTNKELKSHAKMMEGDHKKLGEKMQAYAASKNIKVDIDSNDMKSNFDTDKAGADWDKNWVDKMADEHQKTISKFEDKQKDANDNELKTIVTNTLPTLHSHLDMVKKLQDKMQK
jgi:putative membrane protein